MSGINAQRVMLRRGEARDLPFIYRLERVYMQDLKVTSFKGGKMAWSITFNNGWMKSHVPA